MTTKKERMYQQIEQHGNALKAFFRLDKDVDAVQLCKKLRRLELKAHALATKGCNVGLPDDVWETETNAILDKLDDLLGFRKRYIRVFVNGDARGYALKIDLQPNGALPLALHRDWGGYGIIAPEFSGGD